MKILVSVEHPAWAHQFQRLIKMLEDSGHHVKIVAINKDNSCKILKNYALEYSIIGNSTGKNMLEKAWLLVSLTVKITLIGLKYKPDLLLGRASPMMALCGFFLRKKHIIFEDTEHSHISLFFCKLFSSKIVTSHSFRRNLGVKQLRKPIYKESFYLHSSNFSPDPSVLDEAGVKEGERFVLIRFVSWTADHDLGHSGLFLENKVRVVSELSKLARVFVSAEGSLPEFFEPYKVNFSIEKMHSFIYYASLVFGESATMASEAAVLGTHAIFCDFHGRGYTDEQQDRFGLVYNFRLDPQSQLSSINKALELLRDPDLKTSGRNKGQILNKEIQDGSLCMFEVLQQEISEAA